MTETTPIRLDDDTELRPLEARWAEDYLAMIAGSRAHIARYIRTPSRLYDLEATRAFLDGHAEANAQGRGVGYGIWHMGELVGEVSLLDVSARERSASVGYLLAEHAQGRGLVTRACRALLAHGFDEMGLHRIELAAAAGNARSRAIAERLGFTFEGIRREAQRFEDPDGERYEDLAIYGMLDREWRASQARATQ